MKKKSNTKPKNAETKTENISQCRSRHTNKTLICQDAIEYEPVWKLLNKIFECDGRSQTLLSAPNERDKSLNPLYFALLRNKQIVVLMFAREESTLAQK